MADSNSKDLQENLLLIVESAQRQSITWLVAELMAILLRHGYTLEHLIEAVADYAEQNPELESAVGYLEEASGVVRKVLKKTRAGS